MFGLTVLFTLLLFPTGRLLSRRWRPVAWMAGILMAVVTTLAALRPTLTLPDGQLAVPNPIGIAGADPDQGTAGVLNTGLLVLTTLAAFLSLILRFRRAQGEERQQLKWFLYAAALMLVAFLVTGPSFLVEGPGTLRAVIALLPVAAGVAILRYRLYDIDRLISRTLVYGLLTVLLGLGYAGRAGPGPVRRVGGDPPAGRWPPPPWPWPRLPAGPPPDPGSGRPALQPPPPRRRPDHRGVQRPPARPGRPGHPHGRAAGVVDQTMQPTQASLWLRPSAVRS